MTATTLLSTGRRLAAPAPPAAARATVRHLAAATVIGLAVLIFTVGIAWDVQ